MPGGCERCGAQLGSDVAKFRATFSTPNGQPLHVELIVHASKDALQLRPAMFCTACFMSFLEMFTAVATADRITGGQAKA